MKKSYQERKEEVRQQAIDYQNSFTEGQTYFWSELAEIGAKFERLAKRYGLIREFKENGII